MDAKDQALNVARNCFAVRLRKLNRVVSRHYDECFRPFGLTVAQFNLLVAIAAREGTTPSELVASLSLEKSTVSRNVEKMQGKGWVTIGAGEDKRTQTIQLTKAGEALLEEALPAWKEAQKKTEKAVGNVSLLLKEISLT